MRKPAWAALLAFLAIGLLGPRFTSSGISKYSGEQRQYAEDALAMAHNHLDNPFERILLAQAVRVADMTPLPPGTADHLGTRPCRWDVKVTAYSLFWVPYKTITVRCGASSG